MRKILIATALLLFVSAQSDAQFYKSFLPSPGFTSALQKIVLDFRLDYKTIQGDARLSQGEVETYESTVVLPGALSCTIYRFHSKRDTTASWQGIMYQGDNYEDAVKAYKNLYRMVHKSQLRWIDRSAVGFKGELRDPKQGLSFAQTTLTLDVTDRRYASFVADIELSGGIAEWTVSLYLHSRQDDRAPLN